MSTDTIEQKPPLSPAEIIDLRRRVLAKEPVSEEELRHALDSLALARSNATSTSSTKTTPAMPKIDVANDFAAFMAKKNRTDTSGTPQVPEVKPQ